MESGKIDFEENPSTSKMAELEIQRKKSIYTSYNLQAPPFEPPMEQSGDNIIKIGPSKVPVNGNIWGIVASERALPNLQLRIPPASPQSFLFDQVPSSYHPQYDENYCNLAYNRVFGPVAHPDGYVELRLKENIRVLISLDRSILLHNPNGGINIAMSSSMQEISMEHPNGKINQHFDRVDIMTYDGSKKLNNYVRFAKMWEKGVSLTFDGCALIYLVDSAGTRTTSDAVNTNRRIDYCWQVFTVNAQLGVQYYVGAQIASKNCQFFTQVDGTQVFDILGYRVAQTTDGMVRVSLSQNRLKMQTSPTNGSATLTTPNIHCTASLGSSPHLFIRNGERRMHFDGSSFVVRNSGHSAGFDEHNNLRVY